MYCSILVPIFLNCLTFVIISIHCCVQLKDMWLSGFNDKGIAVIASCVDKIEKLRFDADNTTIHEWKILSTAISNRSNPVS